MNHLTKKNDKNNPKKKNFGSCWGRQTEDQSRVKNQKENNHKASKNELPKKNKKIISTKEKIIRGQIYKKIPKIKP